MARPEITGQKPRVAADRPKRLPGPPRADADAVEPTPHREANPAHAMSGRHLRSAGTSRRLLNPRVLCGASAQPKHVLQIAQPGPRTRRNVGRKSANNLVRGRRALAARTRSAERPRLKRPAPKLRETGRSFSHQGGQSHAAENGS